jgi:hypothetical protein
MSWQSSLEYFMTPLLKMANGRRFMTTLAQKECSWICPDDTIFVGGSSTIDCYHHPYLETIASRQACFIKQRNTFKRRKTIQATT